GGKGGGLRARVRGRTLTATHDTRRSCMPDTAVEAKPILTDTGDVPTEGLIEETPVESGVVPASRFYPRPLIFLHIPKAAGTTLQDFILRHYKPGGKAFRFTGHQDQLNALAAMTEAERNEIDVFAGHVHFGIHEKLSEPATYLTMLRDPVERIISHYYH